MEHSAINIQPNYKKKLKQLIKENVPNVEFIKPKCKNEPEKLSSVQTKDEVVDTSFTDFSSNVDKLFQIAKLIRNEILQSEPWAYTGSFDGFKQSELLKSFVKWFSLGQPGK